jgi:hypothetical protein
MAEAPTAVDILTQPFPPEDPAQLPAVLEVFTGYYREEDARIGHTTMPLGTALQMETMFCEGDPARTKDPAARIQWMAGNLAAAGSLRPEHSHFLAPATE